jgi:predicted ATPase
LLFRPEFHPPWPPRSYLLHLTLNRLSPPQGETMVAHLTGGKTLPAEVHQQLVATTDGVPLFVEELTRMVLETGLVTAREAHYALTGPLPLLAIPATLHDALMARLDRLSESKRVAQLGAVMGRQFAYGLLRAVAPWDEAILQRALGQLVEAELLYQRGYPPEATYRFKHALIQEAAHQSLLKRTRQQYHQRIAQALVERFPETAETQPELLAHHYTEAGLGEQALPWWQRAGQRAIRYSAPTEAIRHLTTGLELLKTLPVTPERDQQELTLHIALGAALQMAKGFAAPEVEDAYTRAYALCQQVGETPQLAEVLLGLWRFYVIQPQLHRARQIGEALLRLAQPAHDPSLAVTAHYALGTTWLWLGAFPAARPHLEEGIARYTPDLRAMVFRMGQDPGLACRIYTAAILWLLGYPAQALARLHESLALAHELSHPFSLAWAWCWSATVSQMRRDVPAVLTYADAAVTLSTEQGFPLWGAQGMIYRGWALAMQGKGKEGLTQVRAGVAAYRATGAAMFFPYLCTWAAEVYDKGHMEDGLQALAEAHTLMELHEDRWWEAEVSRLRGVLLLRQPLSQQEEAETWLQRALNVARRQEAKGLELRAAMSLSRLWQRQGKRAAARALLAPIYDWFTEGFDTADLQEAKALLEELA